MPKRIDDNQKQFIINLVAYFQRELHNKGPLLPLNCVQERVANGLGISIRTVQKVVKEASVELPVLTEPPPQSNFLYSPQKTEDLPDLVKMEVRNVIHNMYAEGRDVTLSTLNTELVVQDIVHISKSTLRILLQEIGFPSISTTTESA